jgi:hypothetical protein
LLNERSGTSTDYFSQTSTESTARDAIATVSPRRRKSPPSATTSVFELRCSSALRESQPHARWLRVWRELGRLCSGFGDLDTVPFLGASREVFCEDPFTNLDTLSRRDSRKATCVFCFVNTSLGPSIARSFSFFKNDSGVSIGRGDSTAEHSTAALMLLGWTGGWELLRAQDAQLYCSHTLQSQCQKKPLHVSIIKTKLL